MIKYNITKKGDLSVYCNFCETLHVVSNECYFSGNILGSPYWTNQKRDIICSACTESNPIKPFRKVINKRDIPVHRSEFISKKANSDGNRKKRRNSDINLQFPDKFCNVEHEYMELISDERRRLCYCGSRSCPDRDYNYGQMQHIAQTYKFPIDYRVLVGKRVEESVGKLDSFVTMLFMHEKIEDLLDADVSFAYLKEDLNGKVTNIDIQIKRCFDKEVDRIDKIGLYEFVSGFDPIDSENIKFSVIFSEREDYNNNVKGYNIGLRVDGHTFSTNGWECYINLLICVYPLEILKYMSCV